PLSGAEVRFAVASGAGSSLNGASPVTATNGIAQVSSWTMSANPGANTATAAISGVDPVTFTASSEAAAFSIVVQNIGPPLDPAFQAVVHSARAKWQRIVYRDVADVPNVTIAANSCGNPAAIGPINIDDVLILMRFDSIDGPRNILGQASPCGIRSAERL